MELVMQPNGTNPGFAVSERDKGHFNGNNHDRHYQGDFNHLNSSQERHHLDEVQHVDRKGDELRSCIERFELKNLEATKDALKDILIDQSRKHSEIQLHMAQSFKEAEREQLKNFACLQLEAEKNKHALAMEIARSEAKCIENSCHIKEFVSEKCGNTDKLLREQEERRLHSEVEKLREELIALRLRSTLAPAPIAAVTL